MNLLLSIFYTAVLTFGLFGHEIVLDMPFENGSNNREDTLRLGYTYWWNSEEPIQGIYGNGYALIFTGVISEIMPYENSYEEDVIYDSQPGTIEIMEILHSKELKRASPKDKGYARTDCFYNSGLKKGDKVLVFCFEYEEGYVVPGHPCIVKLDSWKDTFLDLIKKYIDNKLDRKVILDQKNIWKRKGLVFDLEELIDPDHKNE